jgi:glycosyltransferase involved in cell wall biosynthesis
VIVPCKTQKREFFLDAIGSILRQTSPEWALLIVTDPSSPPEIAEWALFFQDPRVRVVRSPDQGFARALNVGLEEAGTEFVSILLSDDRYSPDAVETLQKYRARFPDADFFHSARCYIDESGELVGEIMPSCDAVRVEDFRTFGSPVKHLLCWRRPAALAIGGMDETLSAHGCDDYDFPWRMAESGARFQAVSECLYQYRLHLEHDRLTTVTPIERQVDILRSMFHRHRVPPHETDRFVQRAIDGYLLEEASDQVRDDRGVMIEARCFRQAGPDAKARFQQAGIEGRFFFPHRVFVLPKGGPDGMLLARNMAGATDPSRLREIVLYALPPAADKVPDALNFDDDVQWHQQQFGLPAQIAAANLLIEDSAIRCYVLVSDLVQRIGRAPLHRTQIDAAFKGWYRLLLNAVLDYARENGRPTVYVASARNVLRNSDPRRHPKPELYERIYDRFPRDLGAVLDDGWWRLDADLLQNQIVPLERDFEVHRWPKTVCLVHDIEQGLGHRDCDPAFAEIADRESPAALTVMLEVEKHMGVKSTYNLLGLLYPALHQRIRGDGHALAFHSYDHSIARDGYDPSEDQLSRCRELDYRLKGYRPPQSKIPSGLNPLNLTRHNFEWLASSCSSLGCQSPVMNNGLVWIPIHADDWPMYSHGISYPDWEREIFDLVAARDFVAIGLHDCYGRFWLPWYEQFLRRLQSMATITTMDAVAAGVTRGQSRWFVR